MNNSGAKPAALAHVAIHDTVLRLLEPGGRGRLLDLPAGEGALALRLSELGFEVECGDLYPEIFKLETPITKADLDTVLPFDPNSFETVVCVEGLEHIENPANAIREFARVLQPGGAIVVSVPNIMNVEERLKWLLAGYTSHFKPLSVSARTQIANQFPGMDEIALHVNPIGYSELRYLLEKNGFEVEGVYSDKAKKNSWLFLPFVGLIRLWNRFATAEKRKERWARELNSRDVLLGGNTLIFKAKKI